MLMQARQNSGLKGRTAKLSQNTNKMTDFADCPREEYDQGDKTLLPLCKVDIAQCDIGGRGMVCREAVKKGEELLRVPVSMAFSDEKENLADWPWLGSLDLPAIARLALVILRERVNPTSAVHRWHLEQFPVHVDSC